MAEQSVSKLIFPKSFIACNMHEAQLFDLGIGSACFFSASSPQAKKSNEDAAAIIPCSKDACVLVIADGLGGEKAGDEAAKIVVQSVKQEVVKAITEGDKIRNAILDGIEMANHLIQDMGEGSATTVAVAEINRGFVRSYHVGDSTILMLTKKGDVIFKTLEHSPVAYGIDAGFLTQEQGIMHEDLHIISNVVGRDNMRIDVGSYYPIQSKDTILLSTDGIFDNLFTDQVVEIIKRGKLKPIIDELLVKTIVRMQASEDNRPSKPDDCTAILFRAN
jgi:serine/threonine protein phosphatase PrpC